jgi:hypothetical protein
MDVWRVADTSALIFAIRASNGVSTEKFAGVSRMGNRARICTYKATRAQSRKHLGVLFVRELCESGTTMCSESAAGNPRIRWS